MAQGWLSNTEPKATYDGYLHEPEINVLFLSPSDELSYIII